MRGQYLWSGPVALGEELNPEVYLSLSVVLAATILQREEHSGYQPVPLLVRGTV